MEGLVMPVETSIRQSANQSALVRLLQEERDPFVSTTWKPALFFHYRIEPQIVRPLLPAGFSLETFDGSSWITLVALTMKNFRAHSRGSLWNRFAFLWPE